MVNISLLEKSIPVAPIKIAALDSCKELAQQVDSHLVQFRKELDSHNQSGLNFRGYTADTFLLDCKCPRFGSGEAKGIINESVRGTDLFIMVDVCNHSLTYKVSGHVNHMSPDDHYQDLKRIIATATGKAHRINVIMPFLYESRQHKRSKRESLDCALALQELVQMGVSNIITFDAHDPRVQNSIPLSGFDNFMPCLLYTSRQHTFVRALQKRFMLPVQIKRPGHLILLSFVGKQQTHFAHGLLLHIIAVEIFRLSDFRAGCVVQRKGNAVEDCRFAGSCVTADQKQPCSLTILKRDTGIARIRPKSLHLQLYRSHTPTSSMLLITSSSSSCSVSDMGIPFCFS